MIDLNYQHIALYGDSTQWGGTGPDLEPQGLDSTTLLQRLFTAAGVSATAKNHGLSGLDTKGRLFGSANLHDNPSQARPDARPWNEEMSATEGPEVNTDAGWVVNNTLINDVFLFDQPASPQEFKSWYTNLVTIARGQGRHVVIETPNPVLAFDLPHVHYKRTRFGAYIKAQRDVAGSFAGAADNDDEHKCSVHLVDQFELITEYMAEADWRAALAADDLHPDGVIYAAKALNLFWTLYPLVTNPDLRPRGAWTAPKMPRQVFQNAFAAFTGSITDRGGRSGDKWATDILITAMDS